ncbi:MAG: glycosyltransferase [Bacteriovoracaceae bacterium]|nr:glycosyltransferase [Bacteriovoracaceae bacterium]
MSCDLTVVLPSYLEEENLRLLLPRIKEHCQKLTPNFEVLVVDTMTPMDGTSEVCKDIGVKYLNRQGGNTYGDAVRTGISNSRGEKVVFMDADGSHPPSVLDELYESKSEADIVIASRYIEGGFTENSKILVLMSLIVNMGYRLVLGLKCKDVSNSFKLYPGDALRSLNLNCQNFDIVEEILFKMVRSNPTFKIKEIPFSFKKRMFGETKRNLFVFIFTYVITLFKLRFS